MPSETEVNKNMRAGTGFLKRDANFEGRQRSYWVFVPNDYTPTRKWPAIVFLHGWAQGGSGGVKATDSGIGPWLVEHRHAFRFIVVFPQSKDGWWTDSVDQDDAIRALTDAEKEFKIDPNHVALMGISTGAHGSWLTAARYPQYFSALVPMAGWAEVNLAPKLAKMPVWMFHYNTDPIVWEKNSEEMVDALKKAGGNPKFTVMPGLGHYVWEDVWAKGPAKEVFDWLGEQKKQQLTPGLAGAGANLKGKS